LFGDRDLGYDAPMAEMQGVYSNDRDAAGMCYPRPRQEREEENMSRHTPEPKLPMASGCYVPGRVSQGMVDPRHCVSAHPHLAEDAKPSPGLRMNPNPEGITVVPPERPAQPTPASQTWWGRAAGRTWSTIQNWFGDNDQDIEPPPAVGDIRG
jgi:hypothetical protein